MGSTSNGGRPMVLVGFAEAAAAPEVVWSLVDAGFQVTAFARQGRASALRRSRHVTCADIRSPERHASGALDDLRSLMASKGHGVLFPLDDTAVWLCTQAGVPAGWTHAGPAANAASLALNKQLQVEEAARAGFRVPETAVARTRQDLRAACTRFPLILKSASCAVQRDGRVTGGRTWVCAGPEELERACAAWDECAPLLVQPFIDGVGEGIFGFATATGVRGWSGHRRIRMMNPQGSGASACVAKTVPDELKETVRTFVAHTGWRGLFMIELLRDRSGRAWFVELNGRPWGSMALARRQGLEYPAWQVVQALDGNPGVENAPAGVPGLVCRNVGREIMHLLFVLRGPKSKALTQWPSIWAALGAVAGIRPSDALYNWRRDDPAVFLSDCYHTLHDNIVKARH